MNELFRARRAFDRSHGRKPVVAGGCIVRAPSGANESDRSIAPHGARGFRAGRFHGLAAVARINRPSGLAFRVEFTRRGGHCAFTLIEIVLAITIAVALLTVMLGFHQYAQQVRADVVEQIDRVNERRMVMDRLTRDLRNTLGAGDQMAIDGTTDSVTLLTTALPGPAVYNDPQATREYITPQQDLRMVKYALQKVEDERGEIHVAGLACSVEKLIRAKLIEEQDPTVKQPQAPLLAPSIRFVRFRYFDRTQWLTSMSQDQPPSAVEIALGEQELPEGTDPMEYPYPLFRRVVYIHAAPRQAGGS